jgi:hypothetical protein
MALHATGMVLPSKEEKDMHTFPKNVAKMIFCLFGQTCSKVGQKLQKNEVYCIGLGQILLSLAMHTYVRQPQTIEYRTNLS